jgi:hypothetical protein
MAKYRVLANKQFGLHRGGEIVEHEAKDAAPYVGTHLELVPEAEAKTVQVASVPLPASLAHFADMNAADTIAAAEGLTDAQRRALLAWEKQNKRRVTVISALEAE